MILGRKSRVRALQWTIVHQETIENNFNFHLLNSVNCTKIEISFFAIVLIRFPFR